MSRRTLTSLGVWLVVLLVPPLVYAIQKPRPEDRVLPDFDIRTSAAAPPAVPDEVLAAVSELRRRVPDLTARFHPLTGTLRWLAARRGVLEPAAAGAPSQAARRFLSTHRHALGLLPDDLNDLVDAREYSSAGGTLTHVDFRQVVDGLPVFGGHVRVHMTGRREIVSVSSAAVRARGRVPVERIDAVQAVLLAAHDIRPEISFTPVRRSGSSARERATVFHQGPFRRDIDARLVLFPTADDLRIAWRIFIEPAGFPQAYEILVDAADGRVLYRRNLVQYAEGVGRVLQADASQAVDSKRPDEMPAGAAPNADCPPVANFQSRDLVAPFRDQATVLFNGGRLDGNNVHVFRTATGMEGAAGSPDGEGLWRFDFPFNSAGAAETHLFFTLNFLHDFFYDLGFDEAAGNFQIDNFGRGGVGGDSLNANARATGRNNANFTTPPDGQKPTLNMFLWDGAGCWGADVNGDGTPDLDGAYDSDIVIHEYHHGVSHRLNTNFTGSEAAAIGEGGSDFFAYSINGDTKLAEYSAPPDGIRQVNGKTYADWLCFFLFFCEPHQNGEIWANALWDVRERFRADLVGGSEEAAVDEVHRLYVDALKLSPPTPTMLDLRDAMLLADAVRNPAGGPQEGTNTCRLWEAFAGRGMGIDARDTHDTGTNTVVADFTPPATCSGSSLPAVTIVTTAHAAEAGPAAGRFTLSRTGATDADLTVRILVSGTATPGDDFLPLADVVTIPAGLSEVSVPVTPIDDPLVEPDETVIATLASGAGYLVGAPNRATVTIASDDVLPDLTVTSLFAPGTAAAGSDISVSETTANQGAGAAPASATRFYLSTNLIVDPADRDLGGRPVPELAPGGSHAATSVLTVPADVAPGTYFLLAKADGGDAVVESLESNNVRLASLLVGPDLVVTALTAPAAVAPGSTVVVSDTTRNQGAAPAGASATRLFLSADFMLDAGDTLLATRNVPALAAGAPNTGAVFASIPSALATGSYYLIARADAHDAVSETQEANNTKFAIVQVGGDLVISALSGPATAAPGATVTIVESTKNQGSSPVAASTTGYYLSADAVLDASDPRVTSRTVPALAAGAVSSATVPVLIPAGTPSGTFYLFARADDGGAVAETQETNNTRLIVVRIGADLMVSAITAPASAVAGASLTVGDTTANQGSAPAGSSTTRYYLSTNPTLDGGDTRLGSSAVPALAAGAANSGTVTVSVPGGVTPGTYFLLAIADADGTVQETIETNNFTFRGIQIAAP